MTKPLLTRAGRLAGPAVLFLLLAGLFMGRTLLPPAGQALGGYDMRGIFYILYQTVRQSLAEGRLPLWTPYLFNGFPLLADPQVSAFYPPTWLAYLLPANIGAGLYILFHIWLSGLGMYLMVRHLGGRRLPALLAGCAFAFSGLLGGRLWAGHNGVIATFAWAPWLVLALAWAVRCRTWPAAVLAGIPFGLAILAGHPPSFLYLSLIWAAMVGYLLWSGRGLRRLVLRQAVIMAGAGLALAAVQLVPFLQASAMSNRAATADYTFATAYSFPPAHLITLIVPQFFGEPSRVGYWSVPTFEEMAYFVGVLAFLGLALALARPTRLAWFYLGLMVGGLWLALGEYGGLYKLLYDWLPPFQVMRAPARAAFLYTFAAAALLGHSLSHWQTIPPDERRARLGRLLRWTVSVWTIAGVAALAATGAVFMAVHPTDTSGRLWQQIGGYAQAIVVFLFGSGLAAVYLTGDPAGRRRRLAAAGLVILVLADMWIFSQKFARLEPVPPDTVWLDGRAVIDGLDDEAMPAARGRVLPWGLDIYSQNQPLLVELPSMFGYNSLEPAAHLALTNSVPDPRSSAYDVLATAYVLSATPLDDFTGGDNGLVPSGQQGAAWLYTRPAALPVARLVYATEVIPDDAAAVSRIHQPDFSAAQSAILAEAPPCDLGPPPAQPGTAQIQAARDGFWEIATDSPAAALLILAENAYPGWQVTVDGQPAESLTAYTTIKAVCVPAGQHLVTWSFRPSIYGWGGGLTLLALVLVGLALVLIRRPQSSQTSQVWETCEVSG